MSATPKTPDEQPEQRATDAPPVDAAHASDGRMEPGAPAAGPVQDMPQIAQTDEQPQRRRRRRRRRPRLDPTKAGRAAAPAESYAAPAQALGHEPAGEGSLAAPAEQAVSPQPTPGTPPRKRRRRRPPTEGSAVPAAAREPTAAASGPGVQPSSATERKEPRRSRGHDGPHRIAREERPRERNNRREQSSGPRADADRGARGKRDKRGDRRLTDRPRHRERDDARNKPAPKLHHLETVVDRGFEDVPDPATDGATRRADWAILKRTIADQRTARAVSMIYVLRRDGVETEFAQLSAARAAVNKIITHPEKTTTSKADHAAARGGKK